MIDTKAGNKGGGVKKNQFRERDLEEGELPVLVDLTRKEEGREFPCWNDTRKIPKPLSGSKIVAAERVGR